MYFNEIAIFVIILITDSISTVASFQYDPELTNENHTKIMFAKILNSLVKVNEERIANLDNIYLLNNYNYGKDSLRTFHNVENYEDLIKNMRVILSELHNNENRAPYPFNPYQMHDMNFDHYLRQVDVPNSNPENIRILNNIIDVHDDLEVLTPDLDVARDDSLKFYLRKCNSEERCQKSCRAALRRACDDVHCYGNFRREMKRQCRRSCERYFD